MSLLLRLLFVVMLLAGAAPAALVRAQETEQEAAPATVPGLIVASNEATVDFPAGITFTLDAETDAPISNLELLYHATGLETWSVELPPFTRGATTLAIEHPVDLRAGNLPPGLDVIYHWRITEENGDVVETPEQTLLWADDRYEWTPLSGPNVTVYTYNADSTFQQEVPRFGGADDRQSRRIVRRGAGPADPRLGLLQPG